MSPSVAAESERMSGTDAAWLHMDRDDNPMVVNILLHFDNCPDWTAVEAAFIERIVDRYPRFRARAVESDNILFSPRWVIEEPIDPRSHFVHVDLEGPNSDVAEALHRYIGEQAALPLDRNRPLWQLHHIGLPGGGGAALLRTHHAMADGAALSHLLSELTDPVVDMPIPETSPAPGRPILGPVLQAGATAAKLGGRLFAPPRTRRSLSGIKTVSYSASVPLARLSASGRGTHSTINDVALATIAGALRTHRLNVREAPENLDVVVPFNLRRSSPAELGNQFGLVFVTLPVARPQPRERMQLVTQQMRRIKNSHEPEIASAALARMGSLPPSTERLWTDSFAGDAGAVITNVVGPRHAVSMAGTPLHTMVLWVPCTGAIGLGISLFSYDGRATIGLIADTAVTSDLGALTAALNDELEALDDGAPPPE
jgi:diacylglycerol O-acyltransferase / wax synthase